MNSNSFALCVASILFLSKGAYAQRPLSVLRDRITALEDKLEKILPLIDVQQATIQSLEVSASAQNATLNELRKTVDGQQALLEAQNNTIHEQRATIQSMEASASEQTGTLEDLRNTVNGQQKLLQNHSSAIDAQHKNIQSLEASATTQNDTIRELRNTVNKHEALLGGHNDTIDEQHATIQSLEARTSSQNDTINELRNTVNGQQALLEAQNHAIAALRGQNEMHSANLIAVKGNCTSELYEMIDEMEFINEAQLNATRSSLEAKIDSIAVSGVGVSTNNTTTPTNYSNVDAQMLESLATRVATLQSNSPFNCVIDKDGTKNCVSDDQVSVHVKGAFQVGKFGSNPSGPTPPEQTEFDVILVSPGGAKLNVVKAVKSITGLGLKEAKEIVDSAPAPVKEGVTKEEAESIKKQLEEAGAEVEIK